MEEILKPVTGVGDGGLCCSRKDGVVRIGLLPPAYIAFISSPAMVLTGGKKMVVDSFLGFFGFCSCW